MDRCSFGRLIAMRSTFASVAFEVRVAVKSCCNEQLVIRLVGVANVGAGVGG